MFKQHYLIIHPTKMFTLDSKVYLATMVIILVGHIISNCLVQDVLNWKDQNNSPYQLWE